MTKPSFEYEEKLWSRGINTVIGADEVGRGSFAGPVVVSCVGFDSGVIVPPTIPINDSKIITHKSRIVALSWIKDNASKIGIGVSSVREINKFGIVGATNKAYRRAVKNAEILLPNEDNKHLLVDGFSIPYLSGLSKSHQTAIIKGDSISISIASASIVAKVSRDEMMTALSITPQNSKYGWDKNKGYGTRFHREAILRYGITKQHRLQFVETFLKKK